MLRFSIVLRDNVSERVRVGVRDRDEHPPDAELARKFRRAAVERDVRTAAPRAHDFYSKPARLRSPAGAQRLHRRLFRGEAPGVALIRAHAAAVAVADFAFRIDAVAKPLADARILQRTLNPAPLDQIDPDA